MLDATKPTDTSLVSELPYYIRQTRAALNAVQALDSNIEHTVISLAPGTTTLMIPDNLSVALFEIVFISATGECNISAITGGVQGQMKVFVFGDSNVKLVDGSKGTGGTLYLNQLPVGSIYEPTQDSVIAFVNVNGAAGNSGYWKELFRMDSVK